MLDLALVSQKLHAAVWTWGREAVKLSGRKRHRGAFWQLAEHKAGVCLDGQEDQR